MKRWLLRFGIVVIVLVVLAALAVQIILWTDLPHRMVINQLQRDTGLLIEADRLRTGWGGSSRLEQVAISLPGDDEPFAIAESARIEHAGLLPLLWGSDIRIKEIHLDGLSVKLVQDAAGHWTQQRIGELTAPAPAEPVREAPVNPYADLEVVRITNGRLEVVDSEGRNAVMEPIALEGDAIAPGTLRFAATAARPGGAAEAIRASGHLVMRGQWPHQLALKVSAAQELIGDWLGEDFGAIAADVNWDGRLAEGNLRGRLVINAAEAAGHRISGAATIVTDEAGVMVAPRELEVVMQGEEGQTITFDGGELRLSDDLLSFERVAVAAADAKARVSGEYNLGTKSGQVAGQWTGTVGEQVAAHGGSFEGTLTQTLTGLDLRIKSQSTGEIAPVKWNGTVALEAKGPQWTQLAWTIAASDGEIVLNPGGPPAKPADPQVTGAAAAAPWWAHDEESADTFMPVMQYAYPAVQEESEIPAVRPPLRLSEQSAGDAEGGDGAAQTQAPPINARPRRIPLNGLAIAGRIDWPMIHLDSLRHSGDGSLSGDGEINAETLKWEARIKGKAVELSPWLPVTDIDLAAHGDADVVRVQRGILAGEQHHISLYGSYALSPDARSPVSMRVKGTWWDKETGPLPPEPPSFASGPARSDSDIGNIGDIVVPSLPAPPATQAPAVQESQSAWTGRISFEGNLEGEVDVLDLKMDGRLTADALRLNGQAVRALAMDVRGTVTQDQFSAHSGSFDVMDGSATMEMDYRLGGDAVQMKLNLEVVSLAALLRMVDPNLLMQGRSSAKLRITIPVKSPREMLVGGSWRVEDFSYQNFQFERLTGRLRTREPGVIELNPIIAVQGNGQASGSMEVDLRTGVTGQLKLDLVDWPVEYEPQAMKVGIDGGAAVNIDFIGQIFAGAFNIVLDTQIAGHPVGAVKLVGEASKERIELRIDGSRLLEGDVAGTMTLLPGQWWKSFGHVTWRGVQPAALLPWMPQVKEIEGSTNGRITFAPSKRRKAHEPLHVELAVEPIEKLTYRRVPWGPMTATIYGGDRRWVMDEMDLAVASGRAKIWASLHHNGGVWNDHVVLRFSDLNLDELRLVFPDETYNEPTPGRLSGTLRAYGELQEWASHGGGGSVRLVDSDLKYTDVMGRVMAALGAQQDEPVGAGLVDLRFENAALWIDRFIYRNRATEILLTAKIEDIRKGMESEIRGDALGSLRLLKDVKIGGADTADRMLRAFQSNATAVIISGKLNEPVVEQAIAKDVEEFITRMFGK